MDEGAVVDQVLTSLKWNGFYQTTRCTLLFLTVFTFGFHSESVVFIGKSVDHKCRQLQSLNVTVNGVTYDVIANSSDLSFNVTYGECSIEVTNDTDVILTTDCVDGFEYQEFEKSSFVSEWDLVCDRESLSDTTQTIFVAGEMFGSFFLTRFADTYGRKKSFLVTNFMSFATSVICSFPPNFVFYVVFKFAFGAFFAVK
ncbi:hypothetical protein Btru_066063 [Bulinus truncatus]|nr:hypothetical protein Btru_066063 [Bulinus truncatus]